MSKKIIKILSIRINLAGIFVLLAGCAAPVPERAIEDVGPVTAYARNVLADENPAGLIRLGEGFERSGDYVGARRLYAQAMAVAPELIDAQISYARASAKVGRGDEAVAILISILNKAPNNRQANSTLAAIHAEAARYKSAVDILVKIENPTPQELVDLGKVSYALGLQDRAVEAFASAINAAPNDPAVLEAAALSYGLSGNYASAVGLLSRAMDNPEHTSAARASLAKIYALSGQRSAAVNLARGVMSAEEVNRLEFFYRLLPRFTPAEQAAALYFNHIPKDAVARLSGNATN
ncbi:tetratricopeptide repeat protein [Kordiimonas aquimaris]|uniref:tetratricopeptide repeat protein n=1 Tax=Kordiimonas aquimaris TaxID=707591 RepID=UPI0021D249C5|nr:tetratricopeptide repeat protein [Kordiimonas aquimaris]